jgi:hypothetical protein
VPVPVTSSTSISDLSCRNLVVSRDRKKCSGQKVSGHELYELSSMSDLSNLHLIHFHDRNGTQGLAVVRVGWLASLDFSDH